MTIAVTAATGQLGTLVVHELLKRTPADQVVAVVRDETKATDLAAKGVTVRVADYSDPSALEKAFENVDRVLLISGNEVGQRVTQHGNVIDAARAAGATLVAYTSVLSAPTSTNPVAPDHQQTEAYLAASGVDHVLLRNGWYTENHLADLDAARATGAVTTNAGDGRTASAARADYAEAAAIVLTTEHPRPVYELSGDVAWNYDDLAATLGEVLGEPVAATRLDTAEFAAALTAAGLPEPAVGFLSASGESTARGDLGLVTGDLRELLGRPTTPIVETFRAAAR